MPRGEVSNEQVAGMEAQMQLQNRRRRPCPLYDFGVGVRGGRREPNTVPSTSIQLLRRARSFASEEHPNLGACFERESDSESNNPKNAKFRYMREIPGNPIRSYPIQSNMSTYHTCAREEAPKSDNEHTEGHRRDGGNTTEQPSNRDRDTQTTTFCTTRARAHARGAYSIPHCPRLTATIAPCPCGGAWGHGGVAPQGPTGTTGPFTDRTGTASARRPRTADCAGWATRTGSSWRARGTSGDGSYANRENTTDERQSSIGVAGCAGSGCETRRYVQSSAAAAVVARPLS
ncbi:hypothetical protein C8Q73DRAFT_48194 [Cubamyces lactineus]|nr:hypothetical protein C8Q73DRAFT_48194 [Cubamyces lactineus]